MAELSELSEPAKPVDILIAGGGPAGTAVAFRARELGMSVLVVDYDDLMKRIRDYAKDKLILPSFGGGDQMCFPVGGDMISCLHFDPIDKDDMCARWKALYSEHEIPANVGAELTALECLENGNYSATLWNHRTLESETCEARHVVLALGRGVPRRFDIPGNTDGIAYRLSEPEKYVGRPACVIGGGTSAAEAVIAISDAKDQAGDPTSVYWSYRGDKMPRISKALAGAFFSAYVGNGNIRYFRRSEPVAIFVGDDREEYLAIRIDRRQMENRPSELTMLEFPKEQCIASIGEDIPEALLNSFGIHMVIGGAKSRKRMVVNLYLETCQPNLYLVGDLLSQAYFETEDFEAAPEGFREVKHRGNIKSALRDGVLVAQVIRQRLDGRTEIDITVAEAEAEVAAQKSSKAPVPGTAESGGPPPESLEAGREDEPAAAILIRVLPTGVQEDEFLLAKAVTTIGRGGCDLSFPNDSTLSDIHASVSHSEEGYFLRDDGGATGVFLRAPAGRKLEVGDRDLVRVGRQFLLFSVASATAELIHYNAAGKELGRHPIGARAIVLGRDAPDVTLDAEDTTLSRRHLAVSVENGKIQIKDLKSVNGSYLKVRTARRLEHGDRIRIGQQSFIFSERPAAALDDGLETSVPVRPASKPVQAETESAGKVQDAQSPAVTFRDSGETIALAADDTVCEAAEASGVGITAECHSGICGSDPIRILSGAENLVGEISDQERETLEEICELEPGPCRLACMVRVRGAVEVELIRK
ncbi:MAG: FHA domain-containing protein [Acidobacteria bacterium]|nr:FHA domain-containing protein [Acidobacteriota bacterium]